MFTKRNDLFFKKVFALLGGFLTLVTLASKFIIL